jgi:hypothetical protein
MGPIRPGLASVADVQLAGQASAIEEPAEALAGPVLAQQLTSEGSKRLQ